MRFASVLAMHASQRRSGFPMKDGHAGNLLTTGKVVRLVHEPCALVPSQGDAESDCAIFATDKARTVIAATSESTPAARKAGAVSPP